MASSSPGNTSTVGQAVTFTATIAPTSGTDVPTGGTVQFYDNAIALGGMMPVSGGQAQLVTSDLALGTHPITASYSGTDGFAGSSDLVGLTQTVNPPRTAFEQWSDGITNRSKIGPNDDSDADAVPNIMEFAFNGDPNSAASTGMVHVATENSPTFYGGKVLVLTIAVRAGTPADWTFGNSTCTTTKDGVTYTIEGGTTLGDFSSNVSIVGPFDNNTYAPDITAAGYEWRRFVLTGSVGLGGKGFLRAMVVQP